MSAPWMPLYVADYLADTGHLSASEHGAYLMLIMHYWRQGSLPIDDGHLQRIARMTPAEWRRSRDTIEAFFGEGWTHARIDAELAKSVEKSARRAESGSRGGKAKAKASKSLKSNNQALANATILPEQNPSIALASSSHSQSDTVSLRSTVGREAPPKPDPKPVHRRSKIPESAQPDEADRKAAADAGMDPPTFRAEWQRFRDHHLAAGSLMADWHAAWRKWTTSPYRLTTTNQPRAGPRQKPETTNVFLQYMLDEARNEQPDDDPNPAQRGHAAIGH